MISLPKCHLKEAENCADNENNYLYDIANHLLEFMEERGFTAEPASFTDQEKSPLLNESVSPYYRDYVANPEPSGYRSLHITFYDNIARCYVEMQLRTKELDVNMFSAVNNSLINDGCGLYRGRLILPYEHLSRFQNDLVD